MAMATASTVPQCCIPAPPCQYTAVGREEVVGKVLSYVVDPPPSSTKGALLFFSDIFGFEAPVFRKVVDKIAAHGYFIIAPDLYNKDYYPGDINALPEWLKRHQVIDVLEDNKSIIEILKSKGFQSIGAVGFCWGAQVVAKLADGNSLKAGVFCHPSYVDVNDIKNAKIPLAILAAEYDDVTPSAVIKQFAEVLESRKEEVESYVNIYPGVPHGWTCRYDVNDETAVARADEAHKKILEWFGKYM